MMAVAGGVYKPRRRRRRRVCTKCVILQWKKRVCGLTDAPVCPCWCQNRAGGTKDKEGGEGARARQTTATRDAAAR